MKLTVRKVLVLVLLLSLKSANIFGQTFQEINWISFSQLNDSLKIKSKKVFVNFYADWCSYCKEMDRATFTDERVVDILKNNYYAVKMNVESLDSIIFGGQMFVNKRYKKVNPVHEIPLLMAGRKDKPFSLPAFILLDEEFSATARYFQFLDVDSMIAVLKKNLGKVNN